MMINLRHEFWQHERTNARSVIEPCAVSLIAAHHGDTSKWRMK